MRQILLTQGQFAIVDDSDYEELSHFKWYAVWASNTRSYYAKRGIYTEGKWRSIFMHRQILGSKHGDKRQGDHINGETLDNRKENIRIATSAENNRNAKRRRNSTTGAKGVSVDISMKRRKIYAARIRVDGKLIRLGYFSTIEEAHAAYATASKKFHGEFGRTS